MDGVEGEAIMSDTYVGHCDMCENETDLIDGLCEECAKIPTIKEARDMHDY